MIKKINLSALQIIILSILFLSSNSLFAPPLIKIAVVDWSKVTMNYSWYQEQSAKILEKRNTIDQLISREKQAIKKMEKDLDMMYDLDEIEKYKQKIMKRKNDLDNFYKETGDILSNNEEILFKKTKEKILAAIKEVAISQGISLVFSKENLLYAAEDYTELTHKVLKKLNNNNEKK